MSVDGFGLPHAVACFTFDNMGEAADISDGLCEGLRPDDPSLVTGYPRVLDMLDRHELRSTFFIEGWNGIHHPEHVRHLVERGHEIGMHGWMHERWVDLDEDTERRLATEATDALSNAAGCAIRGFRAPGGARSSSTEDILVELGYKYDASLGDGMNPSLLPSGLGQIPFVWSGVDGAYYLRNDPADPNVVESKWIRALERVCDTGGLFLIIAHAFVSGIEPARLAALDRVIGHARSDPGLTVMTPAEIAARLL